MANLYKHYKGDIYNVIGLGRHTENSESLVLYEDSKGGLHARPVEIFNGEVLVNGIAIKRFEHIGDFYKR